jgi:hypothetical protein
MVSAADSLGEAGQTVDAGEFQVENTTADTKTISEVEIDMSDPLVVSSLTLTGSAGGATQAATITTPADANALVLGSPLQLAPGSTAVFTLSAVIAEAPSPATPGSLVPILELTTTPTPSPSPTPEFTARRDGSITLAAMIPPIAAEGVPGVLALVTCMLALCAMTAAPGDRRRMLRLVLAIAPILIWLASFAGCGAEESTTQTVAAIRGEDSTAPVTYQGVPISLGRVSRPQPLAFEGSSSIIATPIPLTPTTG